MMAAIDIFGVFVNIIAPLLVTAVFLRHLIARIRNKNKPSGLRLPPGSFGWPILGETLEFLRSGWDGEPGRFLKQRMEKHQNPPVFKTSLTGEPVAVLTGPAAHKFLFGNENKLVQVWWPPSAKKLLGNGLSNSVGEEAKHTRKMLFYFLSPDALMRLYIKTVDQATQNHIAIHWQGISNLTYKACMRRLQLQLLLCLNNPLLLIGSLLLLCPPRVHHFLLHQLPAWT